MNHPGRQLNRQLAEMLYDDMDSDKLGTLNLENMKKLYENLSSDFTELIKEKLRKFVLDSHRFSISKEEFLSLFPKNATPTVYINLSHIKDAQRIKELSQSELKNVIHKRIETKAASGYQPKFIKKTRSSSRPVIRLDDKGKSKDALFVRKAYFSSLS
jgi:hypothetical protein